MNIKGFICIFILSLSAALSHGQVSTDTIMERLYNRGDIYGVNMRPKVDKYIDSIYIVDTIVLSPDAMGYQQPLRSGKSDIYIRKDITGDDYVFEGTLAHEIGHALGLEHCCVKSWCANIMAGSAPVDPDHLVYQIKYLSHEYDAIWNRYFEKIKQLTNEIK